MGKAHIFILVLMLMLFSFTLLVGPASASVDYWSEKAPMNVARSGLGIAAVNGEIYAIGGDTSTGYTQVNLTKVNEEYDPATNTWTYKSPMPIPSYLFVPAVYHDKIYCIAGELNQVYDATTDTWETELGTPNNAGSIAETVNGIIYVWGGGPEGENSYSYNPATNVWTTISSWPTMNEWVSAVANNKIYFFAFNKTEVYDPSIDSWSIGAPEPALPSETQPCQDAWAAAATTGVLAPERIFVLGSNSVFGGSPCFNRIYDPQSDSWTNGSDIPTDRIDFGAAVVNDQVYVVGGCTLDVFGYINKQFPTNEQYTPAGYSGPGLTTPTPTITPTPATQTPVPATQTPNKSPNSQPMLTVSPIEIVTAVMVAAVITASVLIERRRRNKSNRLLAK